MSMLGGAAAILVLGMGLTACGDSGGSGTNPDADAIGSDSFVPTDTLTSGTDTTTTNTTDTTTTNPTDTTTTNPTDTTEPTDTTTPPPARQCTDAELETLNTCLEACPDVGGDQCVQACFNGLSTGCNAAYTAFVQCVQTNSCFNADNTLNVDCAAANCPDQVAGVFGSGVEPSDCDPVTSTGCTETQTCTVIDADNNLGCAPKGTVPTGGDCANDLCEKGACLTTDSTTFQCYEFCDAANNTCPEGRPCNVGLQGTDLTVCGDIPVTCDVLAQDCTGGKGCYFIDAQGNTDCAANAGKTAGQSCQYINDCAAGLMCAGQPATCLPFCATDGTKTCTSGTCTSVGIGVIGVCAP